MSGKMSYDLKAECPVCIQLYEEPPYSHAPLIIPCGHSICKEDVKRLAKQDGSGVVLTCPIDNKVVTMPAGGIDSLPCNYALVEAMKELKAKGGVKVSANNCDFSLGPCEDNVNATHRCMDCQAFLCRVSNQDQDGVRGRSRADPDSATGRLSRAARTSCGHGAFTLERSGAIGD